MAHLRYSNFKPHGHREETIKLPEDHLLSRLGGDGLQQQRSRLPRVHMLQEAVRARLAESSQLLVEVDKLPDGGEGVSVVARNRSGRAEHVGQEPCMSDLLIGHKLDQESVFGVETSRLKFIDRELSKTMVEEVKLDIFLIQPQRLSTASAARIHLPPPKRLTMDSKSKSLLTW